MARFLVGRYDNAKKPSWVVWATDDRDRYHAFTAFDYKWEYSRQQIIKIAESFGLSEGDLEFCPPNVQ